MVRYALTQTNKQTNKQDYYSSYGTISRLDENGRTPRKNTWYTCKQNLACLTSVPCGARIHTRYSDENHIYVSLIFSVGLGSVPMKCVPNLWLRIYNYTLKICSLNKCVTRESKGPDVILNHVGRYNKSPSA